MCNLSNFGSSVYQFDGFNFSDSIEQPNYWCTHSHEEMQITLPLDNTRACVNYKLSSNKNHVQHIKTGEAFLISPNQDHALNWQKTGGLTLFYIHPRFFAKAISEPIENKLENKHLEVNNNFLLINDFLVREIGFIFRNLYSLGLADDKLYTENLANLLAVHLLKKYLNYNFKTSNYYQEISAQKLKPILEYIEANLERKITLSDLANIANLGKFYFSRSFKKSLNMTPYNYVLQQRVKRAKKLLRSSDLSICHVALECGFSNQSHLSRHFRQKLGITPMNYRKSVK